MTVGRKDIGELLVDNGVITPEDLELVHAERDKTGEPMPTVLERMGLATESHLKNALELQYGVNFVQLKKYEPQPELVAKVPALVVQHSWAMPIAHDGNRITVAMVDPGDKTALDEIKQHLNGMSIKTVVCLEDDFKTFVVEAYGNQISWHEASIDPVEDSSESTPSTEANEIVSEPTEFSIQEPAPPPADQPAATTDSQQSSAADAEKTSFVIVPPALDKELTSHETNRAVEELIKKAQEEAIVLLANQILGGAIKRQCSNIHIMLGERLASVQYRLNGALYVDRHLPLTILPALVARYKMMARLNLEECTVPQDGHIKVKSSSKEIVCLISTVPSPGGEQVVIWIL